MPARRAEEEIPMKGQKGGNEGKEIRTGGGGERKETKEMKRR